MPTIIHKFGECVFYCNIKLFVSMRGCREEMILILSDVKSMGG